ncbi:MAG: glycoside hydrolase family 127 protein, partial [Fimbriimonas sp.]|nr:glycoside hydrolase family 127 protein [Fimbriimonas sp.]
MPGSRWSSNDPATGDPSRHMKDRFVPSLAILACFASVAPASDSTVRFSALPAFGKDDFALSSRAPLAPSAFEKLPIGSIRPNGWVRKQLELEAQGFTGRLTEISPWLKKQNNAWLSPTGQGINGWEEVPYWLKGFGDLGYVLGDRRIIDEAKIWINAVIASQRPNGYFGPESNLTANNGKPDVWPNMVMLAALKTYYEYSGDRRVLSLMSRYFQWELTIPDKEFLLSYWEPQRTGDNMDAVLWLYDHTGDKGLFELVEKLHRCGANWAGGVPNWHGVNMAQGFREPAEYYVLKKDPKLVRATETDYETMRRLYGQTPGGLYGADENARPGYHDPRQAAETCTMVEMMLSDEMLLRITGDPVWASRCEDVTFNSLPASMTADLKALHYLTSPNMVQIDKGSKSPDLQNGGPMLLFNAYDHRCCQHNASHGWPYYAEHLWLGTAGNGLATALFAPCQLTARAGNGSPVTIVEDTQYPFDETVRFRMKTAKPNRFPLTLRWPEWCKKPALTLNGMHLKVTGMPGGYLTIARTWRNGDRLTLTLPMEVRLQSWAGNKGSLSVERGPLTYSLKIGEKYVRQGGTDKFPSYEI